MPVPKKFKAAGSLTSMKVYSYKYTLYFSALLYEPNVRIYIELMMSIYIYGCGSSHGLKNNSYEFLPE
jgi:hypothetical protein